MTLDKQVQFRPNLEEQKSQVMATWKDYDIEYGKSKAMSR